MNRLIGVMAMAVFGGLWLSLASTLGPADPAWTTPVAIAVAGLLSVGAWWFGRGRNDPRPPVNRRMAWIGIGGELILLIVAANMLAALKRLDLLTPVVAIVVGAHFLPLARAFSAPVYNTTGVALIVIGLAGLALGGDTRVVVVTIGVAATLWLTCASIILKLRRAGRRPGA